MDDPTRTKQKVISSPVKQKNFYELKYPTEMSGKKEDNPYFKK